MLISCMSSYWLTVRMCLNQLRGSFSNCILLKAFMKQLRSSILAAAIGRSANGHALPVQYYSTLTFRYLFLPIMYFFIKECVQGKCMFAVKNLWLIWSKVLLSSLVTHSKFRNMNERQNWLCLTILLVSYIIYFLNELWKIYIWISYQL